MVYLWPIKKTAFVSVKISNTLEPLNSNNNGKVYPHKMNIISSPIKHSGWFYLWLCLLAMTFWMNQNGYLTVIEKSNQQLRAYVIKNFQVTKQTKPSNLIKIIDIVFDKNALKKIQNLANQYPYATFSFMGEYSMDFLNQLNSGKFDWLLKKAVFLNQNQSTSLTAISSSNSLFQLPITDITDLHWKTSINQKMAIQPNEQPFASQFVFRYKEDIYPSYLAKTVISYVQNKTDKPLNISANHSSSNHMMLNEIYFKFGYTGEIISNGLQPINQYYKNVVSLKDNTFSGVILVDDLSYQYSTEISHALSNVLDSQYVIQTWGGQFIQFVLLLILIVSIYLMRQYRFVIQILSFMLIVCAWLVIQHLLMSQSIWISLSLTTSLSFISLMLQFGYRQEKILQAHHHKMVKPLIKNKISSSLAETIITENNNIKNMSTDESVSDDLTIEDLVVDNSTISKKSLANNTENSISLDQTMVLGKTIIIDSNKQVIMPSINTYIQINKFGRYQVDGILGRGAMGVVFRGVDPKINRLVAIKTMQLSDDLDSESLIEIKQRFFKEAETAGNLSHANIVTIYDVGEQEQINSNQSLGYIAMDLLTGAPLSEYVTKGKLLPPLLVYQLMIQLADALDYAHQQNVVHRDIKPANIIYDDELQRGTITDFGIAYMADQSKTKTGLIMGSPYYMSPEQITGKSIDGRSDIFSLGVTFYQLLSGHLPFTGDNITTITYQITHTKHDNIKQWNAKLYSSAVTITNKALQKNPEKRYQSMSEFKRKLISALKKDYKKSPLS